MAVDALRREGVPFVSVLSDPTYGGVSASYAMQADVRVAVGSARIGFAGPAVILNTMFEMDQSKFDEACPENFQVNVFDVICLFIFCGLVGRFDGWLVAAWFWSVRTSDWWLLSCPSHPAVAIAVLRSEIDFAC